MRSERVIPGFVNADLPVLRHDQEVDFLSMYFTLWPNEPETTWNGNGRPAFRTDKVCLPHPWRAYWVAREGWGKRLGDERRAGRRQGLLISFDSVEAFDTRAEARTTLLPKKPSWWPDAGYSLAPLPPIISYFTRLLRDVSNPRHLVCWEVAYSDKVLLFLHAVVESARRGELLKIPEDLMAILLELPRGWIEDNGGDTAADITKSLYAVAEADWTHGLPDANNPARITLPYDLEFSDVDRLSIPHYSVTPSLPLTRHLLAGEGLHELVLESDPDRTIRLLHVLRELKTST